MLLSVCMKDYVARSYGHTPRKLPLKGVPSRATSRFIAYQALLLYTMKSFLSIEFQKFLRKNSKLFHCVFVHNAQLLTLFHFSPTDNQLRSAKSALYFIFRITVVIRTRPKSCLIALSAAFVLDLFL